MGDTTLKCNQCWQELEPRTQCIATTCQHLYCLQCAQQIVESGSPCPQCEHMISKSNIKLVHILQQPSDCKLLLYGQSPDTILSSALAAINYWNAQKDLLNETEQAHLAKRVLRVQEACKKKLEEVHNGYTNAKRKYENMLQQKNALEVDSNEMRNKYSQKSTQAKKLQEMFKALQQENHSLKQKLGMGGGSRSMSPLGPANRGGGQMVTTVQRTAVLGTLPDMSPPGNTGLLAHHHGNHSGGHFQAMMGRPGTQSNANFMGGVLDPAVSPPIGAANRRKSVAGGMFGNLMGSGGGGSGHSNMTMMNNMGRSNTQQQGMHRAFHNAGSPSGLVSL